MKPVVHHRLAESELAGPAVFYERRRDRLGDNFLDLIEETEAKIRINPEFGKRENFTPEAGK